MLRQGLGDIGNTAELVKSLADAEELRELALAENSLLLERVRSADSKAAESSARAEDLAAQVDSRQGLRAGGVGNREASRCSCTPVAAWRCC